MIVVTATTLALVLAQAAPPAVRVVWRVQTAGAIRGAPAIADGVVVAGGADGQVVAVALTTGVVRWRYHAGAPVTSAPAWTRDGVIVTTRDNAVHALDRRGRRRWRVATGPDLPLPWGDEGWDYYAASPHVSDGVVYVGSGDGHLYALALRDGRVRWRAATGGRIRGEPALSGGLVVIGSGDGYVYAFDAATGARRWRTATEGVAHDAARFGFDRRQIQGSPTVAGGMILIGARDGALYALDAATGAIRWRERDPVDSTSWVVSRPAVTQGGMVVYGRSGSHSLHGTDLATGMRRWRRAASDLVLASPALAGDAAYVGDGRGTLWSVRAADGAVRWRLRFGSGLFSAPAIGGTTLVIGADDGTLTALDIGPSAAPVRAVYWDSTRVARTLFGRAAAHRRVVDALRMAGYDLLDAAGLDGFLAARAADRLPSVLVFAMDDLPPAADRDTLRGARLREYLDAGGKVVWVGAPPGLYQLDDAGRVRGLDRELPRRLSGLAHDSATSDVYGLIRTPAGAAWGVPQGGTGELSLPADASMLVLAHDDRGRAAAWVRAFGGPPGTGFVRLPPSLAVRAPDAIAAIADAGVVTPLAQP